MTPQLRIKTWDNGVPIWSVWDNRGFIGYVETNRGGFTGYRAYALAPTLRKVGDFERKCDARDAVAKSYQPCT